MVGSVIGFTFGNPQIGWLVGSMVGGMVFPEERDGPQLADLRPQASEYGRPIPIIYGTMAVGGNVIWASDLVKTSDGDGGGGKGGGGGGGSGPTYAANVAILICESSGDKKLGRIWAGPDKRLIYDGSTLESGTLRFYDGREDQMPDPLIESYLGVGNVPAYRGYAYIVIEGFDVSAHDGNRIPFLTVEIGHVEADLAPEDLGRVWVENVFFWDSYYVAVIYGQTDGFIVRRQDDNSFVRHLSYDVNQWVGLPGQHVMFFDPDRQTVVAIILNTRNVVAFELNNEGTRTMRSITAAADADDASPSGFLRGGCYHNGKYIFAAGGTTSSRVALYVVDPDTWETTATYGGNTSSGVFCGPLIAPLDSQNAVFGFTAGTPSGVWEFPITSNFTPVSLGQAAPNADFSEPAGAGIDPGTGYIWTAHQATKTQGFIDVSVTNPASKTQIYAERIITPLRWTGHFTFTGSKVIMAGSYYLSPPIDFFIEFAAGSPALIGEVQGAAYFLAEINTLKLNPTTGKLMAFRFGGWVTFGDPGDPTSVNFYKPGSARRDPEADNVYLGTRDASVRRTGQPLSEVVLDLSARAGLSPAEVDVSELENDTVDGYTLANQVTVKDAIAALMPAHYFDAVEDQGVLRFVKRGGSIVVEIPDDDLGAHGSEEDVSDLYETTRGMDEELPHTFSVNYILAATKYSPATKYDRRLIGYSGNEARLDMPMVFTDTKALQVAQVNLHEQWVGRITYKLSLGRKYAYLMPTDLVGVQGHTLRLTKQTQKDNGVLVFDAVRDDSDVYTPVVIVEETPPPEDTVVIPSETVLELM